MHSNQFGFIAAGLSTCCMCARVKYNTRRQTTSERAKSHTINDNTANRRLKNTKISKPNDRHQSHSLLFLYFVFNFSFTDEIKALETYVCGWVCVCVSVPLGCALMWKMRANVWDETNTHTNTYERTEWVHTYTRRNEVAERQWGQIEDDSERIKKKNWNYLFCWEPQTPAKLFPANKLAILLHHGTSTHSADKLRSDRKR